MARGCMYRAQIIEQPEWEEYLAFDDKPRYPGQPGQELWHRPVGWEASPDYIERFGTDKFFEPNTDRWYKSRSGAKARVDLLNSYGYRAIVQRSAPVVWPKEGEEKVSASEATRVRDAIRVLKDAGLIDSADEILK